MSRPKYSSRKPSSSMKKMYLEQAVKYIEQLEKENEALKTNPDTALGQVITQFRESISANKRLSVLAAAFLKAQGGSITVNKDDLDSFSHHTLNIKWEPVGTTDMEQATEFAFTYEAIPTAESAAVQDEPTVEATDAPVPDETTLESLVAGVTEENLHGEQAWGAAVGGEVR